MKILYGSMDAAAFELSQRSARYSVHYTLNLSGGGGGGGGGGFNTEPTVSTMEMP